MDSVYTLILNIWFTVINTLSDFVLSFGFLSFSLLDFCIAIIVLNILFKVFFILPSRDGSLNASVKSVSEKIIRRDFDI